ncbi:TRAP transporter small permease subunit [Antarctobacter heliothermus]|uniref:TRAP transporter small permease protein n=1 Tax=Antarctobacter heliothermus TaxID=74033 RepID=A0A239CRA9_9RHOB|nr:TRAP transporter small permease [Antarctobacter heliothermus]SNS22469.1 TRAP-type mannitol/chloroaromatic compound transport system, small permease component [Antarctobacter heliothermus]
MNSESVWLGPLRTPVRWAMIVFCALALVIYAWLILSLFITDEPLGVHEMIRPEGRMIVVAMMTTLTLALIFAAIFTSDIRGSIEVERTGPFDILSLILGRLSMIGITFIVLVMFYEVVARYVFSGGTLWANELSLWIAAIVFLFAGLYAMQQRSHIRIYVIYDMMPRWLQKLSDIISVSLIWVFAFCLVWGGYADAKRRLLRLEGYGSAWDPPIPGTVKTAVLVIVIMVALQALSNLIADWNKAPEHHNPADEIDETEIENIRKTLEVDKN